jgi:hypothetical protein
MWAAAGTDVDAALICYRSETWYLDQGRRERMRWRYPRGKPWIGAVRDASLDWTSA